jgi:fructoselysine 6-kinase
MDVYDKENKMFPGGNPVNVAVYIVRLGGEAAYIGPVGTDVYGEQMMQAMKGKGVDISHMKVQSGMTAVTHVEIVDGDRVFGDYEEGVMADFKLSEEDITFLSGYDMVVTGLWGMIESDLPKIQANGTPVAFDFATQLDGQVLDTAIGHVDYAFFAIDDKEESEIREFMREIKARGPKIVVVTRGSQGSIAYDGDNFYTYGIVPCEVVDTMGAGDSFIAGFLYAICEGQAIPEAMAAGAANSSVTIAYAGAW